MECSKSPRGCTEQRLMAAELKYNVRGGGCHQTREVYREKAVYGGRNQSTVEFTKNCGSKLHNQQHDEHKLESKESIETPC